MIIAFKLSQKTKQFTYRHKFQFDLCTENEGKEFELKIQMMLNVNTHRFFKAYIHLFEGYWFMINYKSINRRIMELITISFPGNTRM